MLSKIAKRGIRMLILFYQRFLSPLLHFGAGPLAGCRFEPSCSNYFLQAVETHGVIRGCAYGIWRILRCHPWGGSGYDPVPQGKGTPEKSCDCHAGPSSRH